ncbi:PaaI family thioesterase [Antricoccus suffuscus]|uniref:PaaI family thioesterase n=1 Tax=Antricoccus suffuscus TaxID=1629062 RepID=UPI0011B1D36B|nr:PaaI family thioesterase [Antricoccus suffuscus]
MPGSPAPAMTSQSFDSLSAYLGSRVTLQHDGSTEVVIPGADRLSDADGHLSELAILCAIDIATGMGSVAATDPPMVTLTADMAVNLLARPAPGDLRTVGRVVKPGKRIIMTEAVVTDSTGSPVAFATVSCAPVKEIPRGFAGRIQPGDTRVLDLPEWASVPIEQQYDTTPVEVAGSGPVPVASIELTPRTANPFGFLHGAVGAHLLLSGARRAGLAQVDSITVRYLRPTVEGPADVIVDDVFRSHPSTALSMSLRDRGTGKIACAAHVVGPSAQFATR